MPSKSTTFTPSSILFRPPISGTAVEYYRSTVVPLVVEAPGTAPGSEWFITTAIYRHSRQAGMPNIGACAAV